MSATQTIEEFWLEVHGDDAKWRHARKPQWCGQCHSQCIQPGDRYLDTGEFVGFRATAKCCETCATGPLSKTDEGAAVTVNLVDQERDDLDDRDENHLTFYINRMSNA